jgi:membrane protein DedA with SNARE-associated domain
LPHQELHQLVAAYGYGVVVGAVALEGVGIPVPGETILIAAAVLAATSQDLNILLVIAAAAAGAILGDNIGFWIGRGLGYPLLLRYRRRLHVSDAKIKLGQYLFLRHGRKVAFFGRFVAVLRALNGLLAGVNRMAWLRFLAAEAAGAVLWAALYGTGAYFLGEEVHHLARPAGVAILGLAVAAIVAAFFVVRRHWAALETEAEHAFPGPVEELGRRHAGRQ